MSTPSTPSGGPPPAPVAGPTVAPVATVAPAASPVPAAVAPDISPQIKRRGAAHAATPGPAPAAVAGPTGAPTTTGAPPAAPAGQTSVLHEIGDLLSNTKAKIGVAVAALGLIGYCAGPSVVSGTGDFFRKRSEAEEAAAERVITPRENLSVSAVAQLVGNYRLRLTTVVPNIDTVDSDECEEEHPFKIEVIDARQAGPWVVSGDARITVEAHGKATVYENTEPISAGRTARSVEIPLTKKP